jgi:hypothetical protein
VRQFEINPFVAIMRRYCVDYANRRDFEVCDQILANDYTLHMGEHSIRGRDEAYKPEVISQLRSFPYLGLVVHEIVTDGDHLALLFSEHAASLRHDLRRACWHGIGIYKWDGAQITEAWVEMDFLARQTQLKLGEPASLGRPALDPWVTAEVGPCAQAVGVVRDWLRSGALNNPEARNGHGDNPSSPRPQLDIEDVQEDVLFSAGRDVAFKVTVTGRYRSGVESCGERVGARVTHHLAGVATVDGEHIRADVVSDRLGFARRLRSLQTSPRSEARRQLRRPA